MKRAEEFENQVPDPDFPSGEWIGFYRDSGSNHRQEMSLVFTQGQMSGEGGDDIGSFAIRGHYDAESREVWWTKVYPGSHDVFYKGYREIKGIWGLWDIHGHTDGFHIWPRRIGEHEGLHLAESAEQPVEVVVAQPLPVMKS